MRLFAKIVVIVLGLGAMGLGLLALRQQRYEVSNQISQAHNRIVEQDRAHWRIRADLARRVEPGQLRESAEAIGLDLEPIHRAASTRSGAAEETVDVDQR
jgi:hypothetical protein